MAAATASKNVKVSTAQIFGGSIEKKSPVMSETAAMPSWPLQRFSLPKEPVRQPVLKRVHDGKRLSDKLEATESIDVLMDS